MTDPLALAREAVLEAMDSSPDVVICDCICHDRSEENIEHFAKRVLAYGDQRAREALERAAEDCERLAQEASDVAAGEYEDSRFGDAATHDIQASAFASAAREIRALAEEKQ